MIPPILLLTVLVLITAGAALFSAAARKKHSRKLAQLAAGWTMRFTPDDRLNLTPKVAANFPVPGAADVVLRDLVFDQESQGAFRYIFTVEYTMGVLRTKRRKTAVGLFREKSKCTVTGAFPPVVLAPHDLELQEQYDWLRQRRDDCDPARENRENAAAIRS